MKFNEVIENKIKQLEEGKSKLQSYLMDPSYHVNKAREAIGDVINQLEDLDLDVDQLKSEMVSFANQIPGFIDSVWKTLINDIRVLDSEINRWREFGNLYNEWESSEAEDEQSDIYQHDKTNKDLKELIKSGEIKEPTKMQAIRRKAGEKPPITIKKYRELASEIEKENLQDDN